MEPNKEMHPLWVGERGLKMETERWLVILGTLTFLIVIGILVAYPMMGASIDSANVIIGALLLMSLVLFLGGVAMGSWKNKDG